MSFLGNLVGRAEHTIQNVEHAAGNAINNAVHGGQAAPASTASPQQQRQIVGAINGAIGPQNGPNGAMGRATTMIDGPNGYQIPGPGAWALQQPQLNLGHLSQGAVGDNIQGGGYPLSTMTSNPQISGAGSFYTGGNNNFQPSTGEGWTGGVPMQGGGYPDINSLRGLLNR